MKLSDLNIEESFIVDKVATDGEIRQRIIEMGFSPGVSGWIVRKAPLGDPIQVHIMDYEISLRKSEALGIEVSKSDIPIKKDKPLKDNEYERIIKEDICTWIESKEDIQKKVKAPSKNKTIKVAIAGNPNAGKTTIFNALTGANYKVANYPGVTVERREANMRYNGYTYELIDLPGVYSLSAYSQDEVVACEVLLNEKPDFIVNVIDATNLERNLYLSLQLVELDIPVICILNMYEDAEKNGVSINEDDLTKLLKFPVMKVHGNRHDSVLLILDKIDEMYNSSKGAKGKNEGAMYYGEDIEEVIKLITGKMDCNVSDVRKRWLAIKTLEKDDRAFLSIRREFKNAGEIIETVSGAVKKLEDNTNSKSDSIIADKRYSYIRGALQETVVRKNVQAFNFTEAADVVFLNKFLGLPIFIVVLWVIFQLTFSIGAYPQEWLDMGIGAFGNFVGSLMPDGLIKSVIVDGIIGGVGSVLSFLPLVLILFLGISFLEDSGYMARAAFLMDKIMHKLGLHGQSFIPLFIGFGCSVPAVMATRTLRSKKDRIVTVLITTLMSCGARLPVYVLLIGAFFAPRMGANIMLSLYLIGIVFAFIMAFIFRKVFFRGEETPFVMELPPYRIPRPKAIVRHMFDRIWMYIKRAGTYVLAASIIIWALITFPQYSPTENDSIMFMEEAKKMALKEGKDVTDEDVINGEYDILVAGEGLRQSYAGRLGRFIEPVIKPLGFDWRMGIALIAGAAAKEIVVSTIAQIKGIEEGDDVTLTEALQKDPAFNPIIAYSLLLFILLYMPCMAAVGVIGSEIGKKWMIFVVVYTIALAWIVSFVFYQLAMLIANIV